MATASAIAHNAMAATGARVFGTVLAFVSTAVIARSLGPTIFGHYALVLSTLLTFQVFADAGLYALLLREISRPGTDVARVTAVITSLRLVLLTVVLGIAPLVSIVLPYPDGISTGVAIGAIGFFFLSLSQLLMAVFQKELRVEYAAFAEITGRSVQLGGVVLAAAMGGSLAMFLWALTAGAFVQWILNFRWAQRLLPFHLRVDRAAWRRYGKEALPIVISIVLTMVYFRIDSIFLSLPFINRGSGNPLRDVGEYGVAYKVLEGVIFYPAMFVGLLMPLLSRFAEESKERLRRVFRIGGNVLLIVAIPAVVGLVIEAGSIVTLVGGNAFAAAAPLLQILAVAVGFIFFGALYGHTLIAVGRQRDAAWIYGVGAVVNVVANLLVIPEFRAAGAAATTVATEAIVTVAMGALLARHGVTIGMERLPAVAVASAGMAALLILFSPGLAIGIPLAILTYTLLLAAFRGITRAEMLLIVGRSHPVLQKNG